MVDAFGNWPIWIEKAVIWVIDRLIRAQADVLYDVLEDIQNYDKNNQSEEKALESNYFSCYKGELVIRTNLDRSGYFGAIFLSRNANGEESPEDEVRHEYGHSIQMKQLGVVKYALCIGLPSWQKWGTGYYYDKPFEVTADILGDVRNQKSFTREN